MADKCFCHLNGYKVKDADARKSIEAINKTLEILDVEKFGQIETDIETLKNKDISSEVVSRETSFNADALYYNYSNGLETFIIENYDDTTGIDSTKDDGEYILVNNYNDAQHCITVPIGNIKMYRSTVLDMRREYNKVFVHLDKEGSGTIDVYISSDGGVTFKKISEDTVNDCNLGKQFVIQLKLTGSVTLHNLCWGVKS